MNKQRQLGAVVLAAGKSKRMSLTVQNKVTLKLKGKPMILHGVGLLKDLRIEPIVVVVGFAKESVVKILGSQVIYATQQKRLGTGKAVLLALAKIPQGITDVLVVNGDDSAFYTEDLMGKLIEKHFNTKAEITFLTIEKDNPSGLGRIIRDKRKKLVSIVEDKNATNLQKQIKEVNPQCFVFRINFLKKYLKKIKKNKTTREYYLTDLVGIAIKNRERIETVPVGKILWRGINTKEELLEAEKLFKKS
jgi:bifunctional UDP-N-acetylglucosamine pyrophosphorylase/glucosamine-1-phosphate N-acetyltransferase